MTQLEYMKQLMQRDHLKPPFHVITVVAKWGSALYVVDNDLHKVAPLIVSGNSKQRRQYVRKAKQFLGITN